MARPFKVETVHKYMYPGTYNFRDDADGDFPSGWTDNDGADCETTVIASLDGHKKVLQLSDANGAATASLNISFTQGLNTEIEFWLTKSSVAANTNLTIHLYEGGTICVTLIWDNNDLDYYDGAYKSIKDDFLVANTLSHFKFVLDDTANTFDCYIDGVLEDVDLAYRNNSTSGINKIDIRTDSGDTGYSGYVDAIGVNTDVNYNIGDNCFWRHYGESTDSFESDDVGTQGTSITWVDGSDTAVSFEIIPEFNEHKKILRGYYSSAVGGYDNLYHDFATQSKTGWFSFWIKVTDITVLNYIRLSEDATLVIGFGIDNSIFQVRTGGAWRQATGSPTPVNDTWYHVYIRWYDAATDTFDLFIDNVQYEDGTNCQANQTAGINKLNLYAYSATEYVYIDAPISSLDGDSRGDNRTFDYNSTYTKTDITTDVKNVLYKNEIYKWREAILLSETSYENSEVFFQVYDVNSKLAIDAEIKKRDQLSKDYTYSLRDKNQDDLENRSSNTFTADDIHDPTDITSMLKVILPNLDHSVGDLILVNADTKTDTYSPTTQNYPDYEMLRDISDLADSVVIIEASGKCHLDDDLASGTALDLDTVADKDKMTEPPLVTDILEDINYFEIFGAMNPDTGTRFYKIIDNTGDDKKKSWRYTNNAFKSQTDVDAYAAALNNRTTTIKNIKFTAQSIGTHNMGETIDYKFIDALYNVPQANYYVIYEEINFDLNENTIILSEGMIENSKYAATYELPENYNDSYAAEIFDTDVNTITPEIKGLGTATESAGFWVLDAVGEGVQFSFFLDEMVDTDRDIVITWGYQRTDGGADTVDITEHFAHALCDGVNQVWTTVWNAQANSLPADALTDFNNFVQTLPNANLTPNSTLYVNWKINEALKFYGVKSCVVRYYIKRSA